MKKYALFFIVLLLVSVLSLFKISLVQGPTSTDLFVNPSNVLNSAMQPKPVKTTRPVADSAWGYSDWTKETLTTRPSNDGDFKQWTGRSLAIKPNGHGTYAEWSSWVHLTPNGNGNYSQWLGGFSMWDDWPNNDGDDSYLSVAAVNKNQSSQLANPPTEPRVFSIVKVRLTVVAKGGTLRFMLVFGAPTPARGYNGSLWTFGSFYETHTSEWGSTNPDTKAAWTWADIDWLEGGVRSCSSGEIRVTQLYISVLTSGVYTDWYDWPGPNGDTNYVFTTAALKQEGSALTDHTAETWDILKLRVYIVAKANKTGATVQPIIVVGGNAYTNGSAVSLTTGYTEISSEWWTNPSNGSVWNWWNIDRLEAGVKSVTVPSLCELRVTQLYVKVIEPGTYQNWDEAVPNGDTDFLSTRMPDVTQSSTLQSFTHPSWTIARVQVSIVAKNVSATDDLLAIVLVIGGNIYYVDVFLLATPDYVTYSSVWLTNPAKPYPNDAWTWSDIDTLQVGVQSILSSAVWEGELRVTQIYVVVAADGNYTQWNETTQDGNATYVSATRVLPNWDPMVESSQLAPISPMPSWSIGRVRVVIYATATVPTDEQVQPVLVIGGGVYASPIAYTPTTATYSKYTGDWGKNPSTNGNWSWSDIGLLEAGVQSVIGNDLIWTGEIRVTQLYVEIASLDFGVQIKIANVIDLFGYEFKLNYNTSVVSATSIWQGSFFPSDSYVWHDEINDTAGYAWYSLGMPLGSHSGVSGSGILATIYFTVVGYGDSNLSFSYTKLINSQSPPNNVITANIYDGYFSNKLFGDVNGNRKVEVSDLFAVGRAFGTAPGKPNWNSECDFNRDNKVDKFDLSNLSDNYGKSI